MLELIVSSAVRTLVLAVIVGLVILVLRVRQPRLQLIAWTAVMGASLAMPMLEHAPALRVSTAISLPPALAGFVPIKPMAAPVPAAQANTRKAAAARPSPYAWQLWVSVLYLTVTVFMLLRLMLGLALSWRLLREAKSVRDGWAAGGSVRVSAAITTPVTIGRTVVLPVDCSDWTADTRCAVLAHERSHVARGDFLVQALSQANRAVFWFSPASWWLHRRLVALAELASDDAAVDTLGDGRRYAAILLEMARRSGPGFANHPARGVAMARPAMISHRIERILTDHRAPLRLRGYRLVAAVLAGLPLALAVAVSSEAQTQPLSSATPPPGTSVQVPATPHKAITIDPDLLDDYVGAYRLNQWAMVRITRDGNALFAQFGDEKTFPIYPYIDNEFFYTVVPAQISFIASAGKASALVLHLNGQDLKASRVPDAEAESNDCCGFRRYQPSIPIETRHLFRANPAGDSDSRTRVGEQT